MKELICPCCGNNAFHVQHKDEECPICGWIDNRNQYEKPYTFGEPNIFSLYLYKEVTNFLKEI